MYVCTLKGTQNQYLLSGVLAIWVGLCTRGIHRDRMRSTYYPGVCTKPGTYYQGWFMYMKYTQGQNEEYLLSRIVCYPRYLLSKFHCREEGTGVIYMVYNHIGQSTT